MSAQARGPIQLFRLPVPVIPVPPGYGHYCSITYQGGAWVFGSLPSTDSDPCGDLLKQFPGGSIQRAGLWNTQGENNVLVRCDGDLRIYRAHGSQPTDLAFDQSKGKKNCIFTVAPTRLPIFGHPWGISKGRAFPDDDVDTVNETGFNYNILGEPWDVSEFGQPQDPHKPATRVDRYGRQQPYPGSLLECGSLGRLPGCKIDHAFEGAYDWSMPVGKPLIAVADGYVVGAVARDISEFIGPNCPSTDKYQQEVFIEHQVGAGIYAERFVSAYHHMSSTKVHTGDTVHKGDVIAYSGTSGCSGGPHLDLSVIRLTNLSGARSYAFATTPHGCGVNGAQGVIDPFGWSAPKGVDPWAWKSLAGQQPCSPAPAMELGAFSIHLWIPGQVPPSY
jgi:murein DD-endopeptidase MepM/ murein hydrolase activator NlpD